jgi:hypothetical protein
LERNQDTRAVTLLGAFTGHFALLEVGINSAVEEVLEVKGARAAIITRNMAIGDKIKTLRTLVDLYIFPSERAEEFSKHALRALKFGEIRNVMAHTAFRQSSKSDGVEFFTMEANSKLKHPGINWSIDNFLRHIGKINQLDNRLRSIESRMSVKRVAKALIEKPCAVMIGPKGASA